MRSTQSAYSQLGAPGNQWGSTSVIDNPVIQSIALKQSASPAQVILIENYMFKLMAAQRTTKRDVSFYAKKRKTGTSLCTWHVNAALVAPFLLSEMYFSAYAL